jgi:hypothetical protein
LAPKDICGKGWTIRYLMGKLCEFLALNIVDINNSFIYNIKLDVNIDNECYIGIKAKASALQQHNSNALCVRVHVFQRCNLTLAQ